MLDYPTTSLATGLGFSFGTFFLGFLMTFLIMLFFVGLMIYYFTGTKPGGHLLSVFMRVAARFYTQIWMFSALFLGWYGLFLTVKSILGSIFPDFVYGRAVSAQVNDLQVGIVLAMFAVIVFSVHWGIAYIIETKAERKGTLATKLFTGMGLVVSGLFFFGSLLMLILEVLAYVQQRSGAVVLARPGSTLALLLATLPLWVYYILRTLEMVRHESHKK